MIISSSSLGGQIKQEPDGAGSVALQDQTSPMVIAKFSNLEVSTTLSVNAVMNARTITVTSATGIVAGKYLTLFHVESKRFTLFYVVSVASLVITLDSLIDFAYPSGTFVDVGITNFADADGSSTPVVYGLRNNTTPQPEGIALEFDITRIIIKAYTAAAPDLTEFVDLTALEYGLLFRRLDGLTRNIFNVKSNGDIAGIAFDWSPLTALGAGQDGFVSRLTFSGQNKMGVALRIGSGQDIQCIVQDDYTGMGLLEIQAEGHIVV